MGGFLVRFLVRSALGALAAYFLDPESGNRRRKMVRDRAQAFFRRRSEDVTGAARAASAEAYGTTQKVAHAARGEEAPADDVTLARKVETEIFRDPDVPKGKINVDAVDGVVTLRGEIDDQAMIDRLERETTKVAGVKEVRNLLHLPGTPAPNLEALSSDAAS